MIVDGVIPGNVGRGYVLRRIIRRALRHGHQLGKTTPFFHQLVTDLVQQMGEAYPELSKSAERVASVIRQEEVRFQETLVNGMRILNDELAALGKDGVLDGQTAFRLYDTFGFPFDLTADVCRERGFSVDQAGYDEAMARQKAQAKASGKFKMAANLQYEGAQTRFEGYEHLQTTATIQAIYVDGTLVDAVQEGQDAIVVLDNTPFYAESGGQVGDSGVLTGFGSAFDVVDTQKIQANVFGHHGTVSLGSLKVGDQVQAQVDADRRAATVRNHSATHLLHKALKQVLGGHVQQRGSLVDADKTRFDFSHGAPVTAAQIRDVEAIVNNEVLANNDVAARVMSFDDAVADGAMALFGEKYGDSVRVLDIGFSRELCGGTHVARTGDIGLFKIVSESGVGEGVRRVEAITGHNAFGWVQNLNASVQQAAAILKSNPADLVERTRLQQEQLRAAEKEMDRLKAKLAAASSADLSSQAVQVKGAQLLALVIPNADPKSLRGLIDNLKNTLKSAIVLLATESDGKVSVAAGVTQDLTDKVKAGDLVSHVSAQIGGKGGGRPDMAMGGGTDAAALPGAVGGVREWVESRL